MRASEPFPPPWERICSELASDATADNRYSALEPLIRLDLQQRHPNSKDLQHTLQSCFTLHELNTAGVLRRG